jgi:hypothetical protein
MVKVLIRKSEWIQAAEKKKSVWAGISKSLVASGGRVGMDRPLNMGSQPVPHE